METQRYTRLDHTIMLILLLTAFLLAASVAWFVIERIPHLEDEITYLFQARTYMRGSLWAPPPPDTQAFFVPFVFTLNGRRIGKYPIGWPMILAIGERFQAGWLVNPVLGALTAVLIYTLARDLYDRQTGLIASLLALTSPFFLIQSSTAMSHAAACFWATLFAWAILRTDLAQEAGQDGRRWSALGGAALGMLILTRALTAIATSLPFILVVLVRTLRHPRSIRTYWPLALIAMLLAALQPLYLYIVTGSPVTNLYTMVWPYDRLGFGPGIGPYGGHTIRQAYFTTRHDLKLWTSELFGWSYASWIPLIPGLVSGIIEAKPGREVWAFLLPAPFILLVIVYAAYWVGSEAYGPRYYYEGHAGLCILAALGLRGIMRLLAGLISKIRGNHGAQHSRDAGEMAGLLSRHTWPVYLVLAALLAINTLGYLPGRLDEWHDLYNITRAPIDRLDELRQTDHVLVFVQGTRWQEYSAFFVLNSPWLDDPIIAAHDINAQHTSAVMALYPDREVWFYDHGVFSQEPRPYPDNGQ